MHTKQQLFEDLRQMNLKSTDTILIHTSMKAIGEVEGGAEGFIDALCEYFKDGLLLIPTHTWDNVNEDQPIYDVSSTVPCIGLIPRRAAFRKDGYRSLHPTHSIWGHGKNAKAFFHAVQKVYPNVPKYIITPLWRKDWQTTKRCGPFSVLEEVIRDIFDNQENITVISGVDLIPHDENLFGDLFLHPNDDGFEYCCKNLLKYFL